MPLPETIRSETPVWCSLRGAIDWLLLDLDPTSPELEYAILGNPCWMTDGDDSGRYWAGSPEVDRAKRWLITAIADGRISYWGKSYRYRPEQIDFINRSAPENSEVNISGISDNFWMINFIDSIHEGLRIGMHLYVYIGDLMDAAHEDISASAASSVGQYPKQEIYPAKVLPPLRDEVSHLLTYAEGEWDGGCPSSDEDVLLTESARQKIEKSHRSSAGNVLTEFNRAADAIPSAMIRCSNALAALAESDEDNINDRIEKLYDAIADLEKGKGEVEAAKELADLRVSAAIAAIDMRYDAIALPLICAETVLEGKLSTYRIAKAGAEGLAEEQTGPLGTIAAPLVAAPVYTNRRLVVLDQVRAKIAATPDRINRPWTQELIKDECARLDPSLSLTERVLLARVLTEDRFAGKS